ncbi:MAG: SUMF1/EgtB/PvdO family nonheme iron enzyme, partial [Chloroflexia bacterium]|nr:SUMF1/EgtB/PvdO family nonheme iron enzyme [Chloroflexia bacterium]
MTDDHSACCGPSRSTTAVFPSAHEGPSDEGRGPNGQPTQSSVLSPQSFNGAGGEGRSETPRKGMIRLAGGVFLMGTDDPVGFPADGEGPVREVTLRPFLLDRHAVNNDRFAAFVKATNYRTEAERFGWSYVFHQFVPRDGSVAVAGS